MSTLMMSVVIPLVVAGLSPIVVQGTHAWVEYGRKRRSFKRLLNDPFIFVGAIIEEIRADGTDRPLVGPCRITLLQFGRMEVETLDHQLRLSFTGREFERLHPVMRAVPSPDAKRL